MSTGAHPPPPLSADGGGSAPTTDRTAPRDRPVGATSDTGPVSDTGGAIAAGVSIGIMLPSVFGAILAGLVEPAEVQERPLAMVATLLVEIVAFFTPAALFTLGCHQINESRRRTRGLSLVIASVAYLPVGCVVGFTVMLARAYPS
ncbi:hypothetical protein GCM10027055_27160 [Janibacter alkaliphilus]